MIINKRKFSAEYKKRISFWVIVFMLFLYSFYWAYVFTTPKLSNVGNHIKILSLAIVAISGYVSYLVWKYRVNKKKREMGEDAWEAIFRVEGVLASAVFLFVYPTLALLLSKAIGGIIVPIPPRRSDKFLITESDSETFLLYSVLASIALVTIIYPLGVFLRYRK
jgi:hypothetical protein